jgi:hypothetical protein
VILEDGGPRRGWRLELIANRDERAAFCGLNLNLTGGETFDGKTFHLRSVSGMETAPALPFAIQPSIQGVHGQQEALPNGSANRHRYSHP